MEKFRLQWEHFTENLVKGLKRERVDGDFVDVSLVASDGQVIYAHKIVLSLASTFFRKILKQNSHPFPMVYLSAVSFEDLVDLLRFMYCGEVELDHGRLDCFLKSAEDLGVEGLMLKPTGEDAVESSQQTDVNEYLCLGTSTVNFAKSSSVNSKEQSAVGKSSQAAISPVQNSATPAKVTTTTEVLRGTELNTKIETFCIKLGPKKLQCATCQRTFEYKRKLMTHVERHLKLKFPCNLCDNESPTRYALVEHCKAKHKANIGNPFDQ